MSLVGDHLLADERVSEAEGGGEELNGDAGVHVRSVRHPVLEVQLILLYQLPAQDNGKPLVVHQLLPHSAQQLADHLHQKGPGTPALVILDSCRRDQVFPL